MEQLFPYAHWWRKVTKSGGANLLTKQYFYCKKLNPMEHPEMRWGCSPIATPFSLPMHSGWTDIVYMACVVISSISLKCVNMQLKNL